MTPEELKKHLEAKGYEVRNIRTFKNSFHVTYWTPKYKATAYLRIPIEAFTKDNLKSW